MQLREWEPMLTVYFDGDATLWDFHKVMRDAMQSTLAYLGQRVPDVADRLIVDDFIADRDAAAKQVPPGTPHERTRLAGFERSLTRLGVKSDALAAELTEYFLEQRFKRIALYPDAVGCLRALRAAGIRVGLLSNGNTYPDRAGLGELFDAVIFAHDVGAPKPDARMYEAAARALPSEHYVMVGDDPVDDVVGAQQCGWQAVWLNRDGAPTPRGISPNFTATNLAQAQKWIMDKAHH